MARPTRAIVSSVIVACALCVHGALGAAVAQGWPSRSLTIVVPYAPGGATDVLGRIYAERLAGALGQPVIVDNKPGGGTSIGASVVARAAPDGHTMLVGASPSFTNAAALNKGLTYDPIRDFVPVALLGTQSFLLCVTAALPVESVADLIAYAKANPGKLNYGSPGVGTPHHLGMEQLKSVAGIDMVHIAYRGGGPLMQDVLAGVVPVTFASWVIAGPHIKSGKLKGLANSARQPITQAPQVPSIAAQGFPDFDVESWFGLLAPVGTPQAVLDRINREVQALQANAELRQRLLTIGYDPPPPDSVAQFWERLKRDVVRWGKVIDEVGLKPE